MSEKNNELQSSADEPLVIILQNAAVEADFGATRVNIVDRNYGLCLANARKFYAVATEMGYSPLAVSNFCVRIDNCLFFFWTKRTWQYMPQNCGSLFDVSDLARGPDSLVECTQEAGE